MKKYGKAWFLDAVERMRNTPIRTEPEIYLISPEWDVGIRKGTMVCPCHADYRHSEMGEKE